MPFAQIIESSSGARTPGNETTSHNITMPSGSSLSLTLITNNSRQSVHAVYRITGHHFDPPAISTAGSGGSDTSADPPNLNPSGWDIEDTLWIAFAACGQGNITAYPTEYNLGQLSASSGVGSANNAQCGIAAKKNAASSENPGSFTLGTSDFWGTRTIGIRPGVASGNRILVVFCVNDNPNDTTITAPGHPWVELANTKISSFESRYWIGYADEYNFKNVTSIGLQTSGSLGTLKISGGNVFNNRSITVSGSGDVTLNVTSSGITHLFPTGSTTLIGTDVTQSLTNKSGSFIQIQIPSSGSAPVFTPTQIPGQVTLYYNTGSNFLYVYNGSAWVSSSFL